MNGDRFDERGRVHDAERLKELQALPLDRKELFGLDNYKDSKFNNEKWKPLLWFSFKCPRCSAELYMVENFPRCECGQKLDWGEFDKDTNVPSKGENDEHI